jgi:hypothetical protein
MSHTSLSYLPENSYKTVFCPFLLKKGFCNKSFLCTFAHNSCELRTKTSPLYPIGIDLSKTDSLEFVQVFFPNTFLYKTKFCSKNCSTLLCDDAHSTSELRNPSHPLYPVLFYSPNKNLIEENIVVDKYIEDWTCYNTYLLS